VFKKLGFQISKQDIQDIISCKPLSIENLLKRVYKLVQKYNPNTSKDNISGDNSNLNLSGNENLNINRSIPKNEEGHIGNISGNYNNANEQQLRKIIEEKDNSIQELKYIVEVHSVIIIS
jgi:hypothetical protein